ncbi:MAG: nitrate reductase [Cyanobacteriota bacterium]|nr:nitrate reductase [Cyanobacteriota bacterium]
MTDSVRTLCPYCGVGCGLEAIPTHHAQGSRWKIRGDRRHPSSHGMVCVKGATILESVDQDRLLYPLFRQSLTDEFERISWEEAFAHITERICALQSTPDAIAMYGSGQFLSEEYYLAQKLLKGCLGTNNFDANSRLCMSSAIAGYVQSLGADGPPCCYDDLDITDCAFLIGSNTAECHPILFNRLKKRHKLGSPLKLIVVDPRKTATAEGCDLHLAIRPGSDIDLLNGIGHLLLKWGELDPEFIDECTQHFPSYTALLSHYPPEKVADHCGIPIADLMQAARYWQESKHILSLWSMGLNQSQEGSAKVSSLINLHLLTGQIGKPGCGPFSLTGQPNAMGGREAGGLSHLLPGYRSVSNPQHRREVEAFWGIPAGRIAPQMGRTTWQMIEGLESGSLQLFWIAATNPLVSLPDLERVKKALLLSPFTIYQDAYFPTETARYAHLLLPACQWSEKTGTMTNSERRVTLCEAFQTPRGEALPDWQIFAEVGKRLGFAEQFPYQQAAEIHQEFVQLTRGRPCDMSGISYKRLAQEGPLQWPCPDGSAGSLNQPQPRLYTDFHFHTPSGRANFVPYHSRGLAEPPDPHYPYVLTTGRVYGHWHTQTRTGRIPKIRQMYPQPFLEIHPRDADHLGIRNQTWVEVRSRRGSAHFLAEITRAIAPGTVFVPMHWGSLWAEQSEANTLTHPIDDPISHQPELKACAVQVLPLPLS